MDVREELPAHTLAHKRQLAWQIIVPLVLASLLVGAGAFLVVSGGADQSRTWADVALVLLAIPAVLVAVFLMAALATAIYGMTRVLKGLPAYSGKVIAFFGKVNGATHSAADKAIKPVLLAQETGAVIKHFFSKK